MFTARHVVRHLTRRRPCPSSSLRTASRSLASHAQAADGSSSQSQQQRARLATTIGALLGVAVGGAGIALMEPQKVKPHTSSSFQRPGIPLEDPNTPPPRPDLPTIALEDMAEHNDESSMWFSFRGAVYDLTFFINGHPGGTPVSTRIPY